MTPLLYTPFALGLSAVVWTMIEADWRAVGRALRGVS